MCAAADDGCKRGQVTAVLPERFCRGFSSGDCGLSIHAEGVLAAKAFSIRRHDPFKAHVPRKSRAPVARLAFLSAPQLVRLPSMLLQIEGAQIVLQIFKGLLGIIAQVKEIHVLRRDGSHLYQEIEVYKLFPK